MTIPTLKLFHSIHPTDMEPQLQKSIYSNMTIHRWNSLRKTFLQRWKKSYISILEHDNSFHRQLSSLKILTIPKLLGTIIPQDSI